MFWFARSGSCSRRYLRPLMEIPFSKQPYGYVSTADWPLMRPFQGSSQCPPFIMPYLLDDARCRLEFGFRSPKREEKCSRTKIAHTQNNTTHESCLYTDHSDHRDQQYVTPTDTVFLFFIFYYRSDLSTLPTNAASESSLLPSATRAFSAMRVPP